MSKSIKDIKEKIKNDTAEILTVSELKQMLDADEKITTDDIDVVTTGTCGVMSGTTAIMHIPISKPGVFKKARNVYINGIECYPGPCPNELLGSVDVIVYGTNHSKTIKDYGGGFLLHDLLKGEEINVQVTDVDNNILETDVTIEDIPYARMLGTRQAFKNYNSFTNPTNEVVSSIFDAVPMGGPYKSFTFSGCGELNPLANDPQQNIIKEGTKLLLNGAEGLVIDNGTRSSKEKPNLMLTADLKKMNEYYLGGFKTGMGPEVFDSVAIPIPVLNDNILENLKIRNEDITLPLVDIHGRHLPLSTIDYTMWNNSDDRPTFNLDKCQNCSNCLPYANCPTNAFKQDKSIDSNLCYGCGICKTFCSNNAIDMELNHITTNIYDKKVTLPVTCRQSDKKRAEEISTELKVKILNGQFEL